MVLRLGDNDDAALPEGGLLRRRIENGDLAIVSAGRDFIERHIEADGDGFGAVLRLLDDGKRRALKDLRLALI